MSDIKITAADLEKAAQRKLIAVTPKLYVGPFAATEKPDEFKGKVAWKLPLVADSVDEFNSFPTHFTSNAGLVDYSNALLDAFMEAEMAKAKGKSLADMKTATIRRDLNAVDVYDEDGEKTGQVQINLKQNHEGKNKKGETFTIQIGVKQSDGKTNWTGGELGKGSLVRAKLYLLPYYFAKDQEFGVSLGLKTVQVFEHVPAFGDGDDMSEFGEDAPMVDDENDENDDMGDY